MKAIQTTYLGATNFKPSRITAKAHGVKAVTISYPYDFDGAAAHWQAALELINRYKWFGDWVSGLLPNGDYVFTNLKSETFDTGRPRITTPRFEMDRAGKRAALSKVARAFKTNPRAITLDDLNAAIKGNRMNTANTADLEAYTRDFQDSPNFAGQVIYAAAVYMLKNKRRLGMLPRKNPKRARRYSIKSTGNGATFTVTRLRDGADVFLQGDDAVQFSEQLNKTNRKYTDDDLASEYDNVMSAALKRNPQRADRALRKGQYYVVEMDHRGGGGEYGFDVVTPQSWRVSVVSKVPKNYRSYSLPRELYKLAAFQSWAKRYAGPGFNLNGSAVEIKAHLKKILDAGA